MYMLFSQAAAQKMLNKIGVFKNFAKVTENLCAGAAFQ